MDATTYEYLMPSEEQKTAMEAMRAAAKVYQAAIDAYVPDGPDKTFLIRSHRTTAMWANVAITRQPDGSPR
jgi:hypothetical protein